MHELFADWYSQAAITADRDTLTRRWAGVEAAVAAVSVRSVPDVCRYAFGLEPKAADFGTTFRAHFKKADESFLMTEKNLHEVRILAGAVLIHQMTLDEDAGLLAAMLAEAVAFSSRPAVVDTVAAVARATLTRASVSNRRREDFPAAPKTTKLKDARKRLEPVQAADLAVMKDVAAASAEAVMSLIVALERYEEIATHNARAASEEGNILWWLCSGWSSERNVAFEQLAADEAPFVLPLELAGLIEIFPAPARAAELLKRAMQLSGLAPETLVRTSHGRAALAASPLSESAPVDELSGLLPLSESNPADERTAPAIDVAAQVVREIVVRRAYREWRDG